MNTFLLEIVGYNPNSSPPGTETLRYSTKSFITGPSDTPANTLFEERMEADGFVKRDMFGAGSSFGGGRVSFGDLTLVNASDSALTLDGLNDYGFDGRDLTLYWGPTDGAFPADFTTVFTATMEQVLVARERVTIKVRGVRYNLEDPFRTSYYAGTGGLEGGANLTDKPKPYTFGKVTNIDPVLVDPDNLIYQVNDGAISALTVYVDGRDYSNQDWEAATTLDVYLNFDELYEVTWSEPLKLWLMAATGYTWRSPDGVTWEGATMPITGGTASNWRGIVYGRGLIVACGDRGDIATSAQGVEWTGQTTGLTTSDSLWKVTYSEYLDQYVAVGVGGLVVYSDDGAVTWSTASTPTANDLRDIVWSADDLQYVAVGNSNTILTSSDGVAWSAQTSAIAPGNLYSVAYSSDLGLYVIGSATGNTQSSSDGVSWTDDGSVTGMSTPWSITTDPWYGFLISDEFGQVFYSTDGTTWTEETSVTLGSNRIYSIASNGEYVVASSEVAQTARWLNAAPITYADTSELVATAPATGNYGVALGDGYFRFGSTPTGRVTCDVTQGATAADRTIGQAFETIMAAKSVAYNSDDIAAADSLQDGEIGFYLRTIVTRTDRLVDEVVRGGGFWWVEDTTGTMRLGRLDDPTTGTAVATFYDYDMVSPLERSRTQDPGGGIPAYRTVVEYARNYVVQDTGLDTTVTAARRQALAEEYREAVYSDSSVQTQYLTAEEFRVTSQFSTEADAQAEAVRVQGLRGTKRDRFDLGLKMDATTLALNIGDIVNIVHPRFGLAAGKKFAVLSIRLNVRTKSVDLTVWG